MRRFLSIAVVSGAGLLLPQMTTAQTAGTHDRDQTEIAALFDRWNDSLATRDAGKVAYLYAPDAVLLPTLSPKARLSDETRRHYFENFLSKGPSGSIDKDPPRVIRVFGDSASDTGHYTFKFADGSAVNARYTFTYAKNTEGQWRIINHHSSALPK